MSEDDIRHSDHGAISLVLATARDAVSIHVFGTEIRNVETSPSHLVARLFSPSLRLTGLRERRGA